MFLEFWKFVRSCNRILLLNV